MRLRGAEPRWRRDVHEDGRKVAPPEDDDERLEHSAHLVDENTIRVVVGRQLLREVCRVEVWSAWLRVERLVGIAELGADLLYCIVLYIGSRVRGREEEGGGEKRRDGARSRGRRDETRPTSATPPVSFKHCPSVMSASLSLPSLAMESWQSFALPMAMPMGLYSKYATSISSVHAILSQSESRVTPEAA